MADSRQYMALEWVIRDIKETLLQAQRALDFYLRDPEDVIQLKFCLTYIHQVYGSLHMASFHGAAMIASEMEVLAQDLLGNSITRRAEASEVLMRSILELPNYLEQTLEVKRDQPVLIFSLLNDLRAVRGAHFLSEATLFSPKLDYAHNATGSRSPLTKNRGQWQLTLSKLRQMYQYATASVIHKKDVTKNLAYLVKVSQYLQKILKGTKRFALWEIVEAFVNALQEKLIPANASIKELLRQLDSELKLLEQGSEQVLDEKTSDDLLKNLLYYLSAIKTTTPVINKISTLYGLEVLKPISQSHRIKEKASLIEMSAIYSVAEAILEEFAKVKETLEACSSTQALNDELDNIASAFRRVADTLAVLSVGALRQKMLANIAHVEALKNREALLFDEELLIIKQNIAEIENELEGSLVASQSGDGLVYHPFDAEQEQILQNSRDDMEEVKDAVVSYISAQWDIDKLNAVPGLLSTVSDRLSGLSLGVPASLLAVCSNYIEMQLINQSIKPEWEQLDSLADVIASIDYYLEVLLLTHKDDAAILNEAAKGLISLGVSPARIKQIIPELQDSVAVGSEDSPSDADVPNDIENTEAAAPLSEPSQDAVDGDTSSDIAEDSDDTIDSDIIDVFIEEADDVQRAMSEYFPQWAENLNHQDALTELRRAFHTLKGSGRMVGAVDIGELSWSIENMLNRIIDKTLPASDLQAALIQRVLVILPDMVLAFSRQQDHPHKIVVEQYIHWAECFSRGECNEEMFNALGDGTEATDVDAERTDIDSSEELDSVHAKAAPADEIDEQLWEIFSAETATHLSVVRSYIAQMEAARPFFEPPSDALQRAMHTIKGSAHMAELTPIAELMSPMELFSQDLRSHQVSIDDDILQLIKDSVTYTEDALEQISELTFPVIPKLDLFSARVAELRDRSVGHLIDQDETASAPEVDPAILEMLMNEGVDLLLDADLLIAQWRSRTATVQDWQPVAKELAAMRHAAEKANLGSMLQLSTALHEVYQQLLQGKIVATEPIYDALLLSHQKLLDIIDAIAAGEDLPVLDLALLQDLEALLDSSERGEQEGQEDSEQEVDESAQTVTKVLNVEPPLTEYAQVDDTKVDEVDDDIVEIFFEEADELVEELDNNIQLWEDGNDPRDCNEALQRLLHTFKGSARLAGFMELGELAHGFEAYLIAQLRDGTSASVVEEIYQYQDQLIRALDRLKSSSGYTGSTSSEQQPQEPMLTELVVEPDDVVSEESASAGSEVLLIDELPDKAVVDHEERGNHVDDVLDVPHDLEDLLDGEDNIFPFAKKPPEFQNDAIEGGLSVDSPDPGSYMAAANAAFARRAAPQEMVKVSAELMEELVNLAGETSISRGRMEEQMSDLGYSLEEMSSTVERLQEQLRRLDIETEAQVIFRQEQMGDSEDFDPLEMDRYSQLQQLSRSLIESASDLSDLKMTLADKARDAETVLLQQSRINTELQEGLMRSRMVPFSRIVPRLRRIVRQISIELDKEVRFEFNNVEGELDRNMMERIIAPLEHMLRNAVDHGVEDKETREQSGKPSAGCITLSLGREGSNVLLHLSDDGAGINVERVREKAIERQLMSADSALSEQDIVQFILQAGFSTAESVTQISGRGVGMDVVNSEIKQLGGSIDIYSRKGEGTTFTIRLPFTLSVNRALMVTVGDDNYAIPLNSIEGITRVDSEDLEGYYKDPDSRFEYAGDQYQLKYLGSLLGSEAKPKITGNILPVPVLLVRSTDHSVALQVDALRSSQEIVVKTLGAQFSAVQGLSGATIMGDGHVVVILDLHAMIRQQYARTQVLDFSLPLKPVAVEASDNIPLVLVVDDSVTVRKVTTRFLEREGYEVLTAKDGMDAMAILQDREPDIMLLDIEMPRMDGFEVARRVRASAYLRSLPIIMITSRTGEKHRQIGLAAGANKYMGKPYQEEELLKNIKELLAVDSSAGPD